MYYKNQTMYPYYYGDEGGTFPKKRVARILICVYILSSFTTPAHAVDIGPCSLGVKNVAVYTVAGVCITQGKTAAGRGEITKAAVWFTAAGALLGKDSFIQCVRSQPAPELVFLQ